MAPQQIQALEILLATVPELEQKISVELAQNPTLELVDSGTEHLAGNPVEGDVPMPAEDDAGALAAEKDEALAGLVQVSRNWMDYASPPSGGGGPSPEEDERRRYLFDSLVSEPSLQENLLAQLRETDGLDEKMQFTCEQVIGSIDETGYLRAHPSDLAIVANADLADVRRAIDIVQGFEPAGIGARDLRECLLLQFERQGRKGSLAYEVVDKFLEDVGRNQIPKVARALHISKTHLNEVIEEIKRMNPFPGSAAAPANANYVYPEVFIERNGDGKWLVRPNRDYVPRLRISPYYLGLLEDPNTPREVKSYIREKIAGSKLLLRAIDQRQSTIERIANVLVEMQHDFFEKGVAYMRPLVMSQVAERIGVHETTVSRAIANKYMQTPYGLFPFKFFFSSGYQASTGEMVSSHGIKQKLQDLLAGEDRQRPYSDQKLAAMLKGDGLDVARRTVAKYREELGILPSNMRRSY